MYVCMYVCMYASTHVRGWMLTVQYLSHFDGHLCFCLLDSDFILLLEEQMLQPLFVDLDFDLILLLQVLKLSVFISKLNSLVV